MKRSSETLKSQSTVGAVRIVTVANEVARRNKPTAFSGAEEDYSDWEFALTCFVGTMDGTLLTELRTVAASPRVKRVPTDSWEREGENALQYPGTVDDGYEAYMNFNFGDMDAMETKFEEFNLLIKEHDDISGIVNLLDTIKRAILVARAPEPLRTHLQLNSESYTTFLEMRQAINQYLKARKGCKLMERDQGRPEGQGERKRQGQRKAQRQEQRKGQAK